MSQGIKQLEEKNVASEIVCMVWSNRMDLVAFSNAKGEVALHRLSWTRAWVLSPPKEGTQVSGIAWRPDGKVLAVAYNTGDVSLIDIEAESTLTKFQVSKDVTFISWVQEKPEIKPKNIYKVKDEDKEVVKFVDLSKPYIRDPPPVSHLEGAINFEDIKSLTSFLQDQSEFNLLILGTKSGQLYVRVFGCWQCLVLDVTQKVGFQCSINNAHFTEDLSKLFVTVVGTDNVISTVVFDTQIFKTHSTELYHITMKHIKFYELVAYLQKILNSITETWESILLEVDQKLAKYANQVPIGGVTADFLDLLMFGVCSERIEEFLICDLTKKGLEKFGQTMEANYSNIQSYLFKHIIKFSQNGTFHLSELKGMAAFEEKFGVIGLDESQIQNAIVSNGAFVIKATEMQQIINHSAITYKAFFRWLYAAIMQLMDEPIPPDIQKMTQQDLLCITEFLQNFDNYGQSDSENGDNKFVMERLGQYLMDEDLTIKPDMSGNDWSHFLEENHCVKNCSELLRHYRDKSLVQVFKELKNNIDRVFETPATALETVVQPLNRFATFNFGLSETVVSTVNVSADCILLALLKPDNNVIVYEVGSRSEDSVMRSASFHFYASADGEYMEETFKVKDIQFYSPSILSVLLQESSYSQRGGIMQLPTQLVLEHLRPVDECSSSVVNAWPLGQKHYKNVDMSVSRFSVSGTRKVSIVLAENRRKVKLFEMECEEEEEEEVEMSFSDLKDSYTVA